MYFNKFITNDGQTIIDLTKGTVTEDSLVVGATAINQNGKYISGKMKTGFIGGIKNVTELPEENIDTDSIYCLTTMVSKPGKYVIYMQNEGLVSVVGVPYFSLGQFLYHFYLIMAGVELQVTEEYVEVEKLPAILEESVMDEATLSIRLKYYILKESGECYLSMNGEVATVCEFLGSIAGPISHVGFANSEEELKEEGGYCLKGESTNIYQYWKYLNGFWNRVMPMVDVNTLPTKNIAENMCYRLTSLSNLDVYICVGGAVISCQEMFAQQNIVATFLAIDELPASGEENIIYILKRSGEAFMYVEGWQDIASLMGVEAKGWIDDPYLITEDGVYAFGVAGELEYYAYKNAEWVNFSISKGDEMVQFIQNTEEEYFKFPKGITSLAPYLCYGRNYKTVELPFSVKKIGQECFAECKNLTTIIFNGASSMWGGVEIEKGAIPEGVLIECADGTKISGGVFYRIDEETDTFFVVGSTPQLPSHFVSILNEINGKKISTIKGYAFRQNTSLVTLDIPENVEFIEGYAISTCYNLVRVKLDSEKLTLQENAFYSNYNLIEIENNSNLSISLEDSSSTTGGLTGYTRHIYKNSEGESILAFVNDCAFYKTEYELVKYYGTEKNLTLPILEEGKEHKIGQYFLRGNEVVRVVIPEGYTTIKYNAFSMGSFVSVTFPASLKTIADNSFSTSNKTFVELYNLSSLPIIAGQNYNSSGLGYTLRDVHSSLETPSKIVETEDWIGYDGDSPILLKYIGENKKTIVFPDDINGKTYALVDYIIESLSPSEIILSDNIIDIGNRPVYSRTTAASTEYKNAKYIGSKTNPYFALAYLTDETLDSYELHPDTKYILDSAFRGTPITSIVLPEGFRGIDYYVFVDCANLVSLTVPSTLTHVGEYAFSSTNNIKTINISSVTDWAKISFRDSSACPISSNGTDFYINGEKITEFEISGIEKIGKYAFARAIMDKCLIREGIKEIGQEAFEGAKIGELFLPSTLEKAVEALYATVQKISLASYVDLFTIDFGDSYRNPWYKNSQIPIYVNEEQIEILQIPGGAKFIPPYFFKNNKTITNIDIPQGVKKICKDAFYNSSVVSVILHEGLEEIGSTAFGNCKSLQRINFPSTLKSLEYQSFYYCEKLLTAILPESLTYAYQPFYYCKSLGKVIYNSQPSGSPYYFSGCERLSKIIPEPKYGQGSYGSCNKLVSLIVPENTTSFGSADLKCESLWEIINLSGKELPSIYAGDIGASRKNICTDPSESRVFWIGDYVFYRDVDKTYLMAYAGEEEELHLPVLDNDEKYHINEKAFYNHWFIKKVIIPDCVVGIGSNAFSGCSNLTTLIMPKELESFGSFFDTATPLEFVEYEGAQYFKSAENDYAYLYKVVDSSLTEFSVLEQTKGIYNYAFSGLSKLTTLTLTENPITIGSAAFSSSSITTVNLPSFEVWLSERLQGSGSNPLYVSSSCVFYVNGEPVNLGDYVLPDIEKIYTYAFYRQNSLNSLTVSDSLREVGDNAFVNCSNLTRVYVSSLKKWCEIDFRDSAASSIPFYTTVWYGLGDTNPLSKAALYVGETLIQGTVEFDETITSIGVCAFGKYSRITEAIFKNKNVIIGASSFRESGLRSVSLPEEADVGINAFTKSKLTTVQIPSGAKIRKYAFSGTATEVTFAENFNGLEPYSFYISSIKSISLPLSVTKIPYYCFAYCSATSINSFGSVTTIGEYAFRGSSLQTVVLPETLTEIKADAFYQCGSIKQINIPSSLITLGSDAFYFNTSTSSVEREVIVDSLEKWFEVCHQAAAAFVNAKNTYLSINGEKLVNATMPEGKTEIPARAFYQNKALVSVVIPEGYQSVNTYAFGECSNLIEVSLPSTLRSCYSDAFQNCALKKIHLADVDVWANRGFPHILTKNPNAKFYLNGEIIRELILTKATSISQSVFANWTQLYRIEFLSSIRTYYSNSFSGCTNVVEVRNEGVSEKVMGDLQTEVLNFYKEGEGTRKVFLNEEYVVYISPENSDSRIIAYLGAETNVRLPDTIEGQAYSIHKRAFLDNDSLVSVEFPSPITSIGDSAFESCGSLESVVWPDSGLTTIGKNAFYYASSLASIKLPSTLTTIGNDAFFGCSKLKTVQNLSSLPITKGSTDYGYVAYYADTIIGADAE